MTVNTTISAYDNEVNFLAGLRDVMQAAGDEADEADVRRGLSRRVINAVVGAGFAAWFVPADAGGPSARLATFGGLAAAVARLAQACPSAAWCALIWATSSRMAAFLPEQGQQEIWAQGPNVPIAASLVPAGTVTATAGGLRLSGEWAYLSGIDHSAWVLLSVPSPGVRARVRPADAIYCAVPAGDYTIRDTWHTLGMRGTGSRTAQLVDVFVPAHRTFDASAVWNASIPLSGAHSPLFTAVAAGAARAAVATCAITSPRGAAHLLLATTDGYIDAGQLLIERACAVTDAAVLTGSMKPFDAARNARDAALVATLLRDAVDTLFTSGGSRVCATGEPLQRLWRDVRTATSHAALNPSNNYTAFANAMRSHTSQGDRK